MLNLFAFKYKHYKYLEEMLQHQECPWIDSVSYKTLPKIGFIVMAGDTPVATGFLRRVEGGYGQLDTFATNPYAGAKLRHEAIELITKALMDEAKSLKLTGLIVFTKDKSILSRAKEKGFDLLPDSLLVKPN